MRVRLIARDIFGIMKKSRTLFGERLREIRTRKGISQKNLGLMVGLDISVAGVRMNQYEVGTHSPKFGTASKIAKALDIPTAYFYAEEDGLAELIAGYSPPATDT